MPKNARLRRVAVAGGFSAGHILPALEVLRAFRAEQGAEGFFVGCPGGLEERIVRASGERLELIDGAPFAGRSGVGEAAAISALVRGISQGRALLRREGTQIVIGFGSYAASGACLAAWSLGIPVVIHEANVAFGQANRLVRPFARRICVAFNGLAGGPRTVHTGTPCRAADSWIPAADGRLRVLVIGGSHGSPHLNDEAPRLLAEVNRSRPVQVVHLTGEADAAAVERAYGALGLEARVEKFVYAMSALYARADFVIACAGGGCLAEIANQGLPALLVPLSRVSEDHQVRNAEAFSQKTGCLWVREQDWDAAEQAGRMVSLLEDAAAIGRVRERTVAWGVPDAAARIVAVCEAL